MEEIVLLFEYLNQRGLTLNRAIRTLSKWTLKEVEDFVSEFNEMIPEIPDTFLKEHIFNFGATSEMSGGDFPCRALSCRMDKVDELARFASIYADTVLIESPLSHDDCDHESVFDAIQVLWHMRPLLEAGLIRLVPSTEGICMDCFRKHHGIEGSLVDLLKRVGKAYTEDLKVTFSPDPHEPGSIMMKLEGPKNLFEHGTSLYTFSSEEAAYWRRRRKSTILADHMSPMLNDIIRHTYLSDKYSISYLTRREVDFEIIQALNDEESERRNMALYQAFLHHLPFLQEVPIRKLITLRQNEGEAFQVYRNALTTALRRSSSTGDADLRELFNDVVGTEIARMEQTIKSSKKFLTGSLAVDLVVASAAVGVGLFTGVLPKELGNLLSFGGALKFATEVKSKIEQVSKDSLAIRKNDYYFLWRLKKIAQ